MREQGCDLTILSVNKAPERYTLLNRKAAVKAEREYKTIGGTAIYKTSFFKIRGSRWLALMIGSRTNDDSGHAYDSIETSLVTVGGRISDLQNKVASCLER